MTIELAMKGEGQKPEHASKFNFVARSCHAHLSALGPGRTGWCCPGTVFVTGLAWSWDSGREPPRFRWPAHARGPHRLGTKRKNSAHPSTVFCLLLHP